MLWVNGACAVTYNQMTWGLDPTSSPYPFAVNVNGNWLPMGFVSSTGVTLTLGSFTTSTIPACVAGLKGAMVYVTDSAAAPVYNSNYTAGGSTVIPVFCNGSNWTNH